MFLLNQLFKFLKLLHSETSTNQLASGFVLGMFMGFSPFLTLHSMLYWLLLLILRINMGAAFLAYALFKAFAYLLDPFFHHIGMRLLTETPEMKPVFTQLFNMAVVPYTRFYNSVVLGSLVIALILAIPLFFISKILIRGYRDKVVTRFKTTWLFRAWSTSKLYGLYEKYQQFRD